MEKHSYFREQLNVLTQFAAAFDDGFIFRYTKDFVEKEKINVRYVFGPKQRVLYDIINQSKNITLPVISIEQKNVRRDPSRIQFKDQHISRIHIDRKNISKIPTPIPIIMDIDVSIITNYKEDIDQISSNLISWCNPYFIISWNVPEDFGMDFVDELRTEVTWSGSVDYENPTNIDHSEKYKIIGNTSFTVKGWIFPSVDTLQKPILVVNTDFITVSSGSVLNGYDDYWALSGNDTTDTINISAYPEFTNYFVNGIPYNTLNINNINEKTFTFYGKRFGFNNTWYLSTNNPNGISELSFEEIITSRYPTISAYRLPNNIITNVNDNITSIRFLSNILSLSGEYVFITANSAGWEASTGIFVDVFF